MFALMLFIGLVIAGVLAVRNKTYDSRDPEFGFRPQRGSMLPWWLVRHDS